MTLVPWPGRPEDIRLIDVQKMQIGQVSETILSTDWDANYLRLYSRTLKLGDKPLAILGVTPVREGYGHGWALIGETILKYPKELTKHAIQHVEKAHSMLQLRRMDITVDCKHKEAYRWANFLGFHEEGYMRSYGLNGEPAYLMARIWL